MNNDLRSLIDDISKKIQRGEIGSIPIPSRGIGYPIGIEDFEKLFYYHQTKIENLKLILEKGLICKNGTNSKAIKDTKEAVFFSEGIVGAICLQAAFKYKFDKLKKGTSHEGETLEEFLGESVFLRFDSYGIQNENFQGEEFSFFNGWTTKKVEPKKLKVCILKNKKSGEITYRKNDIIKYMMAITPVESIKKGNKYIEKVTQDYYKSRSEELSKFNADEYSLEDIPIEKFYEEYIEQSRKTTQSLEKEKLKEEDDISL